MKVNFKFAVPLSLFLEELWLYKFHFQAAYPQLMETCMQEVDIMNLIKMKPPFLDKISQKTHFGNSEKKNLQYSREFNLTLGTGKGTEASEVYFL